MYIWNKVERLSGQSVGYCGEQFGASAGWQWGQCGGGQHFLPIFAFFWNFHFLWKWHFLIFPHDFWSSFAFFEVVFAFWCFFFVVFFPLDFWTFLCIFSRNAHLFWRDATLSYASEFLLCGHFCAHACFGQLVPIHSLCSREKGYCYFCPGGVHRPPSWMRPKAESVNDTQMFGHM